MTKTAFSALNLSPERRVGKKLRFLAADLDGTLLTSQKTITPRSEDVLIKAQEHGLTVILASGRPLYSILPFARQLQLDRHKGFIIAFNGSLVWDCSGHFATKEQTIPLRLIPLLKAEVSEDFRIYGYKGDNIVVGGEPDERSMYISRANKMPLLRTDNFAETITEPQHKCIVTGLPRKLWHLERRINLRFADSLSAYRSESFLLEIVAKGIDKAEALKDLVGRLGGTTDELMSCGYGYNDLKMVQMAGISCAPRNAKEPVRKAATFITESNDRDGVAAAVEHFVLC